MNEFVGQLPALLGVIVGVLASYLAATVGERARWRRVQETRWDEKRAAAYTQYAYLLKQNLQASLRLAENNGLRTRTPSGNRQQTVEDLVRLETDRSATWESVLLHGDADVVHAGRDYTLAALKLEQEARNSPVDTDAWRVLLHAVETTRMSYYEAARRDLGVRKSQPISDAMWSWYPVTDDQLPAKYADIRDPDPDCP